VIVTQLVAQLVRSDSLRFAPPVSGCLAVNVQLNWQAVGTHRGPKLGPVRPALTDRSSSPSDSGRGVCLPNVGVANDND